MGQVLYISFWRPVQVQYGEGERFFFIGQMQTSVFKTINEAKYWNIGV